jgi:hypothetical protein
MRNLAARIESDDDQPVFNGVVLSAFTAELSDLCRKHGLGITGQPTLFVMERDDYAHNYIVGDDSSLVLR